MSRGEGGNDYNSGERLTVRATLVTIFIAVVIGVATIGITLATSSMSRKIEDLSNENSELKQSNKKLEDQVRELEEIIPNYTADSDSPREDDLNKTTADLTKQLTDAQGESESLNTSNAVLDSEKDNLKTENEDLDKPSSNPQNTETDDSSEDTSGSYLLLTRPPYETGGYNAPDLLRIMGTDYEHGFSIHETGYAYFNLNSEFNTVCFDVGHVDGSQMCNRVLTVSLSNHTPITINLSPDMELTHYEFSVSDVNQMKITMNNGSGYPIYGIVNARIY